MHYVRLNTSCGPILGIGTEKYNLFKGVRFAIAQRWERPLIVTGWDGEYNATRRGDACCQYYAFYHDFQTPVDAFYDHECVENFPLYYSEDCLNLNIWTPIDAQQAPVLVFFHGGSYNSGGNCISRFYDGSAYCARGIIVVFANYRLNAFSSAVDDTHRGNYGLRDQIAALRWIKDNIASFGGDPSRVTIAGESAGAMSVQNLIFSPMAKGLFDGAIMMSGGGLMKELWVIKKDADARDFWHKVLGELDVASLDEAARLSAQAVFEAWLRVMGTDPTYLFSTAPVVDGETIPEPPEDIIERSAVNDVPCIIGLLSEDMFPATLYQMALDWGLGQATRRMSPVYGYYIDRPLPGSDDGAYHGGELPYVFGQLDSCWRPFEQLDYDLSGRIIDYFSSFVRDGVPVSDSAAAWKPLSPDQTQFMHFGSGPCEMVTPPLDRLIERQKLNKPFPGM